MSKDDIIREEILTAAKRIFQKWGLKKATMEDIASEGGKAKSTLYYYYKSKEEIFDAAVMAEMGNILARAKASIAEIPSIKERLRTYVAACLTDMKHHALLYSIVWEEIRSNQRSLQKLRNRLEAEEWLFYKELLLLGAESGEFSFADERELVAAARTIAGVVRALFLYLFLDTEESEQIDIAAKLIANGI